MDRDVLFLLLKEETRKKTYPCSFVFTRNTHALSKKTRRERMGEGEIEDGICIVYVVII
jgi:hypothetical protein